MVGDHHGYNNNDDDDKKKRKDEHGKKLRPVIVIEDLYTILIFVLALWFVQWHKPQMTCLCGERHNACPAEAGMLTERNVDKRIMFSGL